MVGVVVVVADVSGIPTLFSVLLDLSGPDRRLLFFFFSFSLGAASAGMERAEPDRRESLGSAAAAAAL